MNLSRFSALGIIAALVGCAQSSTLAPTSLSPVTQAQSSQRSSIPARLELCGCMERFPNALSKIQHVVIIIQENRTTNDLFNGLAGADTVLTA